MQAVVSGRACVAMLIDGDTLYSIHYEKMDELVPRRAEEFRSLLGGVHDLDWINDVASIDDLRDRLADAVDAAEALNLVLYLSDCELSTETRETAAKELEELIVYPEIVASVEQVLFAKPLPNTAKFDSGLTACGVTGSQVTAVFLKRVLDLQPAITAVRLAWDAIPPEQFNHTQRDQVEAICLRYGLFRELVSELSATGSIVNTHSQSEANENLRRELPIVSGLLNCWCQTISSRTTHHHAMDAVRSIAINAAHPIVNVDSRRKFRLFEFAAGAAVATCVLLLMSVLGRVVWIGPFDPPKVTTKLPQDKQLAEQTLLKKIELLDRGIRFLTQKTGYTAQYSKKEVVNGELLEEQTVHLKLAHRPFRVYMKWLDYDTGREMIYGEDINDGNLLVHAGGWKARLPAISMEPDSSLALRETRHPIIEIGLLNLARKSIEFLRESLKTKNFTLCEQTDDLSIGGRDCLCFVIEYRDAASSKECRKSIMLIDKEWSVPLFIKRFGWPPDNATSVGEELDAATMIEQYTYSDVDFQTNLSAYDFDRANTNYGFKRQ
ncbi:MAG: DUF1571 domain-containing protein [Planctomycetota bacterium]